MASSPVSTRFPRTAQACRPSQEMALLAALVWSRTPPPRQSPPDPRCGQSKGQRLGQGLPTPASMGDGGGQEPVHHQGRGFIHLSTGKSPCVASAPFATAGSCYTSLLRVPPLSSTALGIDFPTHELGTHAPVRAAHPPALTPGVLSQASLRFRQPHAGHSTCTCSASLARGHPCEVSAFRFMTPDTSLGVRRQASPAALPRSSSAAGPRPWPAP